MIQDTYISQIVEFAPLLFGFDPAWSERTIDGREIMDVEYEEVVEHPQENIISKQ